MDALISGGNATSTTTHRVSSSSVASHPPVAPEPPVGRVISGIPVAQAITVLASQIPSFDGSEDDDVELHKQAKDWFYMEEGSSTLSWFSFKEAIIARFKRRIPFHVAMAKIEACRWNFTKESFQEYAHQKLKLMHALTLPERDKIQLIINGINSASLRASATVLGAVTISEFLNRMYEITSAFNQGTKKPSPPPKRMEKSFSPPSSPGKKSSPKFSKEVECNYCKAKGHQKEDCFKLKKKERQTASAAVKSTDTTKNTKETSIIGCVIEGATEKLEISDTIVKITQLNNSSCSLNALIDTGSPVSFILNSVYEIFFGYDQRNHVDAKLVDYLVKLTKADLHYTEDREQARQLAIDTTNQLKQYNKVYYDKKHKTPTKYKLGDYVSIRNRGTKASSSGKFKSLFTGPYMISKILDKNRYVVTDIPGFNLTAKPYNSVLSPDRIKYWIKPIKPQENGTTAT
ncbi:hypothetical protein ALC57_02980 [Trachymyrmex cornetzi]|uniref:Uncharacterized protein n=1 Tax=Trachymyrmex cornetzi TaxID=471704 RepID=A0A151JN51_9HYME|nr:hypothetical protein ALC57_02980 [Trachymyrmex cornetzi]